MSRTRELLCFLLCIQTGEVDVRAAKHAYEIQVLPSLGSGDCKAMGLNNDRMVVGSYRARTKKWPKPFERAFIQDAGKLWQLPIQTSAMPLPLNSAPAYDSHAVDINERGLITGWIRTNLISHRRRCRAVYWNWKEETMNFIPGLGKGDSYAYGVNRHNEIVGAYEDSRGRMRAYYFDATAKKSKIRDLGTLGGQLAWAYDINDHQRITGMATTKTGHRVAFRYNLRTGKFKSLRPIGGLMSQGNAIDSAGNVAGVSQNRAGHFHAFLYREDGIRDLGTLGGYSSYAYDIQGSAVVGTADDRLGVRRAFVYFDNRMQDLNQHIPPNSGWFLTEALNVNDVGDILCMGYGAKGTMHPLLLRPRRP